MKAAVYRTIGPASDVLKVTDLPDPQPGPGQVRVRVAVSGVNPTDWKRRAGVSTLANAAAPFDYQIPNQDGAGTIDMVGEGVQASRLGERVWLYHAAVFGPGGTAAEYVCVPQAQAVPLPDGIPLSQGAGLGIPYITAHWCLFADGPVEGRVVVVTGGAGAVGNAAIQLARWAGAEPIATVSSTQKAELARAAGAATVLDYRSERFAEELRAAAPNGAHRVIDVAFTTNVDQYASLLAPGATVASYAIAPGAHHPLPVPHLMRNNVTVRFVLVYGLPEPVLDLASHDINAALAAGALRPLPEHRFPLDQIAAAHDAVEAGTVGKVLVEVAPDA